MASVVSYVVPEIFVFHTHFLSFNLLSFSHSCLHVSHWFLFFFIFLSRSADASKNRCWSFWFFFWALIFVECRCKHQSNIKLYINPFLAFRLKWKLRWKWEVCIPNIVRKVICDTSKIVWVAELRRVSQHKHFWPLFQLLKYIECVNVLPEYYQNITIFYQNIWCKNLELFWLVCCLPIERILSQIVHL